ncbi:multidrug effflux MFS transporter [Azorhizobium doebereinerae]|uniref:multidrug effflux MFS transporter n=1 Tax=Azorhizobium doebereinerae TaxID=281091 RepID=UPI001FD9CB10|nr:multidrug effflux MFS transporter [Azorhizobium doebereinerae]
MSETRTAAIGAMIVVLGPISMSLYTPALPALVAAFHTTPAMLKLTLSVYFFGFAFSQLACGPLSDAFGRRPTALGFFLIYLIGSVVAAFAPDITWLIIGRGLQGVGVAAGPAVSRAIVRDQFTGQPSARIMNLIATMLAIGPAIAPTIGGAILSTLGWQPIFLVMVIYGLVLVALLALFVPETNRAPDRAHAHPWRVVKNYRTLLSDPRFLRPSLIIGFTLGGIYTLAAILPFVLIDHIGLTPVQFGLAMICQTGSFMTGSLVTGRLLRRFKADALIPVGLAIVLVAAAGMAVAIRIFPGSAVAAMLPVAVWAFGIALLLPGGTTSALSGFPHIAGAASAAMGFLQIGGGLLGTTVASAFSEPAEAFTIVIPGMAVAGLAAFALLRPRPAPGRAVRISEPDLEISTDPAGLVGAAGDEIEAKVFRKTA